MDVIGLLTLSTCGDGCWRAREVVCRCSCAGSNHGCLTSGRGTPDRTSRIDGDFYELVAVIPGRGDGECWNDVDKRINAAREEVLDDRFPGVDYWGYGEYRLGKTPPVVDRKPTATQLKWAQVAAVPNAARLVWARPKGSRYIIRDKTAKGGYAWTEPKANAA